MTVEKPLRFACDRCHAQKLRCPRVLDPEKNRPDEPCSRCRKADVPCVVSERGKVGRPAKVNKRKASPPVSSSRSASTSSISSYLVEEANTLSSVPTSAMATPLGTPNPCHVFGFTPDSSPARGLSPAKDDHIMCDPDYTTFYDATNPMMTPMLNDAMLSLGSVSSDDGDANPSWASHSNWSDTTSVHGPSHGLTETIPYHFDVHLDLTPFSSTPDLLDVAPDMPFLDNKADHSTAAAFFEPPRSAPTAAAATFAPQPMAPSVSGTTCFYKLTTLNAKILQFLESNRNMPLQEDCPAVSMNQITKEVVEFSGELIEIAREVMPHINAVAQGINSGASTPSLEDDLGCRSRGSSRSSSIDNMSFFEPESMLPTIPQSSIIFLLLGCYTQLLHSFEFTVYCLYKRHSKSEQVDMNNMWKNQDTVDSLLKASVVIHTITYLLDCVHRAFSGVNPDQAEPVNFDISDSNSWKGFFWGGSERFAKDGLLTRAFIEIQEREQSVMRKAQHLKQVINNFHI
ncbi:hypothetical protein B0I35DRAFT_483655 [Stachybotrys elegans]|uniref:Zn(2)-C6 fungal-type domain-containing protein n=1 Tax=Stachybotrys elegans TaxID=80388 RepID=A0A8K0WMB9_9HYPO|nr:hypothetical protein B0I35DRAFT_483655 [Stachybotrys elegans]